MRRPSLHRPSAATVISLIALCFAMGGTAVAATGGTFILGKANTATSTTSLTNTKGTALSLSSTSSTPPLKVSNSVQVAKLNASELDGRTSSAFLPANGTAVNSSELGGQPPSAFLPANGTAVNSSELGGTAASGYMQGGGDTSGTRTADTGPTEGILMSSPGADLWAICDPDGAGSGSAYFIEGNSGASSGETAVWWNPGGVDNNTSLASSGQYVTPNLGRTTPFMVVVQVDNVTSVSTFTASEWYDSASDTCHFTSHLVTTNG